MFVREGASRVERSYGRTPEHRPRRLRHRRRRRRPLLLEHPDRLAARAGRPLHLRRVVVRDPDKPRPTIPTTDLHRPRGRHRRPAGPRRRRTDRRDRRSPGRSCSTRSRPASTSSPRTRRCSPSTGRRCSRPPAGTSGPSASRPASPAASRSSAPWPRAWPPTRSPPSRASSTAPRNFILTAMAERGASYADALAEAQRLGYAEADPTLDVDGTDAAHKLAILAQIAFGVTVPVDADRAPRHRRPGRDGHPLRRRTRLHDQAAGRGLAATAREVALHVAPVLLRHTDLLAQVRGAYNAIQVVGDAVGDTSVPGRRGRADADRQLRRRRPDRPGRRPGPADVPGAEAVVADETRLHAAAVRTGAQPVLPAAAGRRTSRACWPTWPACWPTSRSASRR